ncbi:hypothetical protein FDECE_205 [Fusarium decemcellulare]|nr:hypothetical protein FDECE_205 [Fusarium decemcellulare]
MARITIVGSGIIGMATAAQLSRHHDVTIVARNLPGDDPTMEWASPWAGANLLAGGCPTEREQLFQRDAFAELWRLCIRHPESSIKTIPLEEVFEDDRSDADIWWKDLMPGFRELPKDELPEGTKRGIRYDTVVLNPHIFLPWFRRHLESSGVKFKRMTLSALSDARHLGHDVLINASGAGPKYLTDVQDKEMELLRGQMMIVKSDYKKCFMRDNGKEYTYVVPRLDGTACLGGIRHKDVVDAEVDEEVDKDILRRINANLPKYFSADKEDYDIMGHSIGIRPYRSSGIRIEKEVKNGQNIVHAYGVTGGGYIHSWGVARQAVKLVDEFLFPGGKANL